MATFTMNMALTTGGTLTGSNPLTDPNAQRIIAYHRTLYGIPNATAQEVWARIVFDIFDVLKRRTIAAEAEAQIAAVVIPPLV